MPEVAWQPIARVGTPKLLRSTKNQQIIETTVRYAPRAVMKWHDLFEAKLTELGAKMSQVASGIDGVELHASLLEDQIQSEIEKVDEAIEHANRRYEDDVLPQLRREADAKAELAARAEEDRKRLDQLADSLSKPERHGSRNW
ncbi:hypothetical protein ACGFIU_24930 [Rhodococcus oryzae]|uniref:hypothetical protein n=1 Tax=Rhodococcus oryzae TaxID=2571143 RepID=UPI0037217AC3